MNRDKLLEFLACPKCHGPLMPALKGDQSGFRCETCELIYPIRDSIPVMLINEAINAEVWDEE